MQFIKRVWCLFCAIAIVAAYSAAQQPSAVSTPQTAPDSKASPEQRLMQRSDAFYSAVLGGDRAAAEKFVSAESRNVFLNYRPDMVMQSTANAVEWVSVDSAVVKSTKTYRMPGGMFDADAKDTWKRIDGEWYLVLPDDKVIETPFGVMTLGGKTDPQLMKQMLERRDRPMSQMTNGVQQVQNELAAQDEAKRRADIQAAEKEKQAKQQSSQSAKTTKKKTTKKQQ